MLSKSLTVVLAALAVTAHGNAIANPEITPAARGEELQERQLSSIISGITVNPGSILSQASSALASITAGGSSNSAQASATGSGGSPPSASGTSPGGIIGSTVSAAGGAASSAAGNSATTSLQVSGPLVFGAATVVLSTLFGAAVVL